MDGMNHMDHMITTIYCNHRTLQSFPYTNITISVIIVIITIIITLNIIIEIDIGPRLLSSNTSH
jgi:hypothetical protein